MFTKITEWVRLKLGWLTHAEKQAFIEEAVFRMMKHPDIQQAIQNNIAKSISNPNSSVSRSLQKTL